MFLIERVSKALAYGISSTLNMDKEREEIIAYGAFAFIQTVWSILLVITFGIIFNVLVQALVISLSISLLRKYSGGAHSSSPNRCALIGAVISTLLGMLVNTAVSFMDFYQIALAGIISFALSYFIVSKLAPVDSAAKPIKKAETRRRLKRKSLCMLNLLFLAAAVLNALYYIYDIQIVLACALCIYIGVIWQAFTLTKTGHLMLGAIDELFRKAFLFMGREKNGKKIY